MGRIEMVHLADIHLVDVVVLVVHPVDTTAHPTVPEGYRWSVMLGQGPFSDTGRCANAGWCPTEGEALAEGEMVAVAVVKALRMAGMSTDYRIVQTPADPIPAGQDFCTEIMPNA